MLIKHWEWAKSKQNRKQDWQIIQISVPKVRPKQNNLTQDSKKPVTYFTASLQTSQHRSLFCLIPLCLHLHIHNGFNMNERASFFSQLFPVERHCVYAQHFWTQCTVWYPWGIIIFQFHYCLHPQLLVHFSLPTFKLNSKKHIWKDVYSFTIMLPVVEGVCKMCMRAKDITLVCTW